MNAMNSISPIRSVEAKVTTLGELRGRKWKDREHMIAPWLRNGEAALLYAPTGLGKTMLALSLVIAMASGGSVAGWHSPKPRRVLLIDGEMNIQDLTERLEMLEPTVNGVDHEAANENLYVYARNDQEKDHHFPDLATEDGRKCIFALVESHRTEVLVVDNLTTVSSLEDENAAASFHPILAFLGELKARGVAVILIHHSGKTGETYRGSSALATTFEIMISLTPPKQAERRKAGTAFDLKFTKVRGELGAWAESREFTLVKTDEGRREWRAEAGEDALAEKVLAALKSGNYATQAELAEACGTSPSKITRLKKTWALEKIMAARDFEGWLDAARANREEEAIEAQAEVIEAGIDKPDF